MKQSMFNYLTLFSVAFIVFGCASQKILYTPPTSKKVPKSDITLKKDFQTVWENTVENLTKSFFVINNIAKESNIINVSFSINNNTKKYIDCGYTTLTVNDEVNLVNQSTSYATYPFVYKASPVDIYVGRGERTQSLDGRINLFIKKLENKTTVYRVNIRYILKRNLKRYTREGHQYLNENRTVSFNSGDEGSFGKLRCRSTGALERQMLALPNS